MMKQAAAMCHTTRCRERSEQQAASSKQQNLLRTRGLVGNDTGRLAATASIAGSILSAPALASLAEAALNGKLAAARYGGS